MSDEDILAGIGGRNGTIVVVYKTYLRIGSDDILLDDIVSYSYSFAGTSRSINFVPTGTETMLRMTFKTASRTIRTKNSVARLPFASREPMQTASNDMTKMLYALDAVLCSRIAFKMLDGLVKGESVALNGLTINQSGFHRSRFLLSPQSVAWPDFAGVALESGFVCFYRRAGNNRRKCFFLTSTDTPNAAVFPTFFEQIEMLTRRRGSKLF